MATAERGRSIFSDCSVDASQLTESEFEWAGREMMASSPTGYLHTLFEEVMIKREQQRNGHTLEEGHSRSFATKIRQILHSFPIF